MSNILVLCLLTLIGFIAHYPSFNLGLYGDDWLVIYLYFVPDGASVRFGPLPGLFTYLTTYGPVIFLMGKLYEVLGTHYHFYYMISLIFKVFASWTLFLAMRRITKSKVVSILVSIIFLVGFTGIQTTDWVFYMNVYLAAAFFFLSLYFQFKFYDTHKRSDLMNQFLFLISSMMIASLRLFPLILIIPLIELSFLFSQKGKGLKITLFKISLFASLILFLWIIGLFGGTGKIYSPDAWSVKEFLEHIIKNPLYSINSFIHWIGVISFPDRFDIDSKIIGAIVLGLFSLGLFISRKDRREIAKILAGGIIFFIFLFSMWFYSKMRLIDSPDRYLLLPFAGFCILAGILSARFIKYLRIFTLILLVTLIGANFLATRSIYKYWLSIGRDKNYIQDVHGQIINNIPLPLTKNDIIYLNFDDMSKDQSVVFGLGYKILILSNTLNEDYFPNIYDNNIKDSKSLIIKSLKDKISQSYKKEDLIERVFAFQLQDGVFKNTTSEFRKELYNTEL